MDSKDQIEEIKNKLDIVNVVQAYVPSLKRSGRNFFGLCPFHKEKSPSFSVNPEIGIFKCFGCSEGGDVIKFLEKIEGLDFPKALELAAQKAGVTLKRNYSPEQQKHKEEKERIFEANHLAAEYYHFLLQKHASGKRGKDYANKRKLTDDQIDKFLIGYAPEGYQNLKSFLVNKKNFNERELVRWGLLAEKNGKIYDKFRDRLMFTIFDHQGNVVGFSGRAISNESIPKYLNSPETPVYRKSMTLFGLYQAKDAIRHEGFAVIVEGNIDLLSSHEAGVQNIVAPLGTALTLEQLRLLKRYCEKVYFALDTDAAGQKALERSLPLIEAVGMQASVLDIGEYKDVDELIIQGGDWESVVTNPQEVVPYFMKAWRNSYDFDKSSEKSEYTKKVLSLIANLSDRLMQTDYIRELSQITGFDDKTITDELRRIKIFLLGKKGADVDDLVKVDLQGRNIGEKDFLVRYLLAVVAAHKNYRAELVELVKPEILPGSVYQNLFKGIWDPKFAKELSPAEQELFQEINLMPTSNFDGWSELAKEVGQLQKRIRERSVREELEALKAMQIKGDESSELMNKVRILSEELAKLKSSL